MKNLSIWKTAFFVGAISVAVFMVVQVFTEKDSTGTEPREEINQMIDGRPIVESIVSEDGNAMIEIAEGSLPEGVLASDLKIELKLADSREGATFYALSPEGIEFSAPVRVALVADLPEGNEYEIPLLLHVYGSGEDQVIEAVETTEVTIDTENGTLAIAGDISHFSGILRMDVRGLFTVTPKSKSTEHNVGETFLFEAEIQPNKNTVNVKDADSSFEGSSDFVYAPGSTWGASGSIATRYWHLKPYDKTVLDRRGLTIHQPFVIKESFTCESAGDDYVSDKSGIDGLKVQYTVLETEKHVWDGKTEVWRGPTERKLYTYVRFKEAHKCLGGEEAEEENYNAGPNPDPEGLACRGVQLQSVLEGGIETVVTKLNDGYCYASGQFESPSKAEEGGCSEEHHHTTLKSIEGSQVRVDSEPCGAATKSMITGGGSVWIAPEKTSEKGEEKEIIIDDGVALDRAGDEVLVPSGGSIEVRGGIFGE